MDGGCGERVSLFCVFYLPCGHDVRKVDCLEEWFDSDAVHDFLLGHVLGAFLGATVDASNEAVTIVAGLRSSLCRLNDHGLLTSHASIQNDHNLAGLQECLSHDSATGSLSWVAASCLLFFIFYLFLFYFLLSSRFFFFFLTLFICYVIMTSLFLDSQINLTTQQNDF